MNKSYCAPFDRLLFQMPRSVAYSGKKKKAQLQQKRQNKTRKAPLTLNVVKSDDDEPKVSHLNTGSGDGKYNRHEKYKLLFQSESREELQKVRPLFLIENNFSKKGKICRFRLKKLRKHK